jgi:hypothetical protein
VPPLVTPAASNPGVWPQGLYLEVQDGQVLALIGEQRLQRSPASGLLAIQSEARLEFGARSVARLVLPGGFQIGLRGAAIIELPAPTGASQGIAVHVLDHARIDLECRRAGLSLRLPGGQVLYPRQGVLRLERLAGERSRIEVRGGLPVELDLGGRYTFELPVGLVRPLPERLDPNPAPYRGSGRWH